MSTIYSGAAALGAAIRAAAALAPEYRPMLPRTLPDGAYHRPNQSRIWATGADGRSGYWQDWHGPTADEPGPDPDYIATLEFCYVADGARGRLTLKNLRAGLNAAADRVNGARMAFDGKVRKVSHKRAAPSSATHVAARALWVDRQWRDALALAENVGAIFFGAVGKPGDAPCPYMSAQHIDAAGHGFTIARSIQSGKFRVLHTASAAAVDSAIIKRGAEGFARASDAIAWLETESACDAWRAKLEGAAAKIAPFDQATGRAYYFADESADDAPIIDAAPIAQDAPQAIEPAALVPMVQAAPIEAPALDSGPIRVDSTDAPARVGAELDVAGAVRRGLSETPIFNLRTFLRVAIERADADSALRTTAKVCEMIEAYAKTYGTTAEDWETESALHICRRRFWNFDAPADPVPDAPAATPCPALSTATESGVSPATQSSARPVPRDTQSRTRRKAAPIAPKPAPLDWRAELLGHARAQHRALFMAMCDGQRWNLLRVPGTTSVCILADGAPQDAPLQMLVRNVHACDWQTMCARAQNALDSAPVIVPANPAPPAGQSEPVRDIVSARVARAESDFASLPSRSLAFWITSQAIECEQSTDADYRAAGAALRAMVAAPVADSRPSVPIHAAQYRRPDPLVRIPAGDPRARVPARFAPIYLHA